MNRGRSPGKNYRGKSPGEITGGNHRGKSPGGFTGGVHLLRIEVGFMTLISAYIELFVRGKESGGNVQGENVRILYPCTATSFCIADCI